MPISDLLMDRGALPINMVLNTTLPAPAWAAVREILYVLLPLHASWGMHGAQQHTQLNGVRGVCQSTGDSRL